MKRVALAVALGLCAAAPGFTQNAELPLIGVLRINSEANNEPTATLLRDELAALVVLDLDGCRLIKPALPLDDLAATASDPLIRGAFRERFAKLLAMSTGSSTRITRAILMDTPMLIDRGEVTDKGSINQRAVLEHRSQLIDELYSPTAAANVITL